MQPYTRTPFQADTKRPPRKKVHSNARAEGTTHQHERRTGANANARGMLDGVETERIIRAHDKNQCASVDQNPDLLQQPRRRRLC